MNCRLFTIGSGQIKFYCTKIPREFVSQNNEKKLEAGNRVTVTKLITEEDILSFAKLTEDFNPIHLKSPNNIVHGAYLNGLVSGVIGTKLPGPGTIVAEQIIRYPKPCYAGDTVKITVEIIDVRKIIKCKYNCVANMERVVLEGEAKLLVSDLKLKKISFTK